MGIKTKTARLEIDGGVENGEPVLVIAVTDATNRQHADMVLPVARLPELMRLLNNARLVAEQYYRLSQLPPVARFTPSTAKPIPSMGSLL